MTTTKRWAGMVAGLLAGVALLAAAETGARDEGDIRGRLKAYAPVRLQADLSRFTPREREALGKVATALGVVDEIYWKQMGRQALVARQAFEKASAPLDVLYRDFVLINYGPFD